MRQNEYLWSKRLIKRAHLPDNQVKLRKDVIMTLFIARFLLINPWSNKPLFLCVCITSLLKKLQEKEKLLIISNFSISQTAFYPFRGLSTIFFILKQNCCLQTLWVWKSLNFTVWERVNPFPHSDTFWRLWETSLLKTLWEKEKLLVTSNFSFSHSVFYLSG